MATRRRVRQTRAREGSGYVGYEEGGGSRLTSSSMTTQLYVCVDLLATKQDNRIRKNEDE